MNLKSFFNRSTKASNKDQPTQQMLSQGDDYGDALHRPLLREVTQIAQGEPISPERRAQVLEEIVELWIEPPFDDFRFEIDEILRANAGSGFVNKITDSLLDESVNAWDRIEAAELANQLGRKEEAAVLLLSLSQGEVEDLGDDSKILEATIAYSKIGDKEVAAARLLGIVTDADFDHTLSDSALKTVGEMKGLGPQTSVALGKLAQQILNPATRVSVANALVKLNQAGLALPVLQEIATNKDVKPYDRYLAAGGLAKAGRKDQAISILLELLPNPGPHRFVGCHIAEHLAKLGERKIGVDYLADAARPGKPCVICETTTCGCGHAFVIDKLWKLGERKIAIALLVRLIGNQEASIAARANSAIRLAEYGEAKLATPVLLEALRLSGADSVTRNNALQALGHWGERKKLVLDAITAIAFDQNLAWEARWRAIEAIGNFGHPDPAILQKLAEIAELGSTRSAREALWKLTGQ